MLLKRANRRTYRFILWLAYPLVRLRLALRARREPAYGERVAERFGHVPESIRTGPIWFHTVSAGETIAAVPLIEAIAARFPEVPILVTTMTPTGSGEVAKRLGGQVDHCYAPYDFTRAVGRFYERVAPKALVLMETELWPNLIAQASARGVPVALVNARLSERSARGYARVRTLTADMLSHVDVVACQTDAHRERFLALGGRNVQVVGSVKFDAVLDQSHRASVRALEQTWCLGDRPVWIAASTHPGEDELVLEAAVSIREQLQEATLILVPRHPVRAQEVLALATARGLTAALQSELEDAAPDVIVGDVMGTLLELYGLADAAFVGGSLVDRGGHNPIEPALWKIPVAMGPYVHNFVEVVEAFARSQGLVTARSAEALAGTVQGWLEDEPARTSAGEQLYAVVADNAGAAARQEALLVELLSPVVGQ